MFAGLCFTPADEPTEGIPDGEHVLVALTTAGQLFCFAGIDLAALRESIESKDLSGAQQVRAGIRMAQTSTTKQHTHAVNGVAVATIRGVPHIVTWGKGTHAICLWSAESGGPVLRCGVGRSLRGQEVVHAAATDTGKLVVLTADTALSVWLLPELVQLVVGPTGFTQFKLFECAVDDTAADVEAKTTELRIAAVTKSATGESTFKVLSLRGMVEHYSLELSSTAVIANIADQESMWMVEGKHLETENMAFQIRCLSPTLPLNRFYNLLHKQRFDEAMELAQLFGLDLEMVHRVKVKPCSSHRAHAPIVRVPLHVRI